MTVFNQSIKLDRAHFYKRNIFTLINLKVPVLEMNGIYLVYRNCIDLICKAIILKQIGAKTQILATFEGKN